MSKAGQKILAGLDEALELTQKPNKRVLVCGGRKYSNRDHLFSVLDSIPNGVGYIIQGEATGADRLAKEWASSRGIPFSEQYAAKWNDLVTPPVVLRKRADGSQYNAAAGGIRNQRMLEEGKPDCVIGFLGGSGTDDMVRRARKAGVPVMRVFE